MRIYALLVLTFLLAPTEASAYLRVRYPHMRMYQEPGPRDTTRPSRRTIRRPLRDTSTLNQTTLTTHEYLGTYQWNGETQFSNTYLRLYVKPWSTSLLKFTGTHEYRCVNRVNVHGTINKRTGAFTMYEVGQPTPTFVTDGKFEGEIYKDWQRIQAKWIPSNQGNTGQLLQKRANKTELRKYQRACSGRYSR